MPTIKDVCQMAGVSKATVSRVLNDTGQVTDATKHKVYTAIQALGYRPNSVARALATRKTNSIGLIVPDFEGAYYGALLQQANVSAELFGKQLVMTHGDDDPDKEYNAITMLSDRRCDAIVLYSRFMPEARILAIQNQLTIPIITVNRQFNNPNLPCISFDQLGAGYMATKYLISRGHTHIACIAGTDKTNTGTKRLDGYLKALHESHLAVDNRLIQFGYFCFEGGYEACNKILQHSPVTAIVASNDEMAIGAQKALIQNGIKIPQQVSVVGIDDTQLARYAHVSLTTVRIPIKPIIHCAIEMAIKLIDHPNDCYPTQFVGELIERDSVITR